MLAVRWYLRYGLSYRDLEELLAERGIEVDHVTLYRWVPRFTPLLIDAARRRSHLAGDRWAQVPLASHSGAAWNRRPPRLEPRPGHGFDDAAGWVDSSARDTGRRRNVVDRDLLVPALGKQRVSDVEELVSTLVGVQARYLGGVVTGPPSVGDSSTSLLALCQ